METEFLVKIKQILGLLDEIDEIIDNNPSSQQEVDYLISDYLHLIENEELSESSYKEIVDKIKEARLKRREFQSIYLIGQAYRANQTKLISKGNRAFLANEIRKVVENLGKTYNYRVLKDEEIDKIIEKEPEQEEILLKAKTRRSRHNTEAVTKEILEELINKGLTSKEIAEKLDISFSTVGLYKRKFGLTNPR